MIPRYAPFSTTSLSSPAAASLVMLIVGVVVVSVCFSPCVSSPAPPLAGELRDGGVVTGPVNVP